MPYSMQVVIALDGFDDDGIQTKILPSAIGKRLQGPSFPHKSHPVLLAWLVPGAGHYYLKRPWHAAALLLSIAGMFLAGLAMQGRMFTPMSGDLFTTIMTYGGYFRRLGATGRFTC